MTTGKVILIITIYLFVLGIVFVLFSINYKPKAQAPVFRNNQEPTNQIQPNQ
jgi:hypothetical protein